MRAILVATAVLFATAVPSQAFGPIQIAFGFNGQRPTGHFLQPPVNFGYYNGVHAMTFPAPHGYQPWTQPAPWGPSPGQFYYYYDPSFSSFGQPSVPGVGPFEGWDAKPNNVMR